MFGNERSLHTKAFSQVVLLQSKNQEPLFFVNLVIGLSVCVELNWFEKITCEMCSNHMIISKLLSLDSVALWLLLNEVCVHQSRAQLSIFKPVTENKRLSVNTSHLAIKLN